MIYFYFLLFVIYLIGHFYLGYHFVGFVQKWKQRQKRKQVQKQKLKSETIKKQIQKPREYSIRGRNL